MKISIVGAGISGLLSAFYLVRAGLEVEMFEKSKGAGGLIRTTHSPFGPLENAAASMVGSPAVQGLFAELGLNAARPGPRAGARYIYRGFPRRWPLNLNQSLRLAAGAARLVLAPERGLDEQKSVRQWGREFFGESASSLLLETALQGVYAGDSARMSAQLVLGPVLKGMKMRWPRPGRPRHGGSAMPEGGMGNLVSALVSYLERSGVRINYQTEVKSSDIDLSRPWIIATPIGAAGSLLAGLGIAGGDELQNHEMLDLASVHLVFENSSLPFEGVGCLFPASEGFNSLGVLTGHSAFPDQFKRPVERWFIGGAPARGLLKGSRAKMDISDISDGRLVDLVLADRRVLTGTSCRPGVAHVLSNPASLPHFTSELARIRERISLPHNLYLLGNYTAGIGLTSILGQCRELSLRLGRHS